jgi:phosphorylase kinase alpha/beta subunit
VRLAYLEQFPEKSDRYDEHKSQAWSNFYDSSPLRCAQYTAAALRYLTELGTETRLEAINNIRC